MMRSRPAQLFLPLWTVVLLHFGCSRGASPPAEQTGVPPEAQEESLAEEFNPPEVGPLEAWTGDLDEMDRHRMVRVLVAYNRTLFFYDQGKPRGITWEAMAEFEKFLNRKLHPKDRTGKEKIQIVFIPTTHLIMPRLLAEGYGDLAAANLTIDPEREAAFDFSVPTAQNIKQVVVTGPAAPALGSLEDLAGKEVYVKATATHFRNLLELSRALEKQGKPGIRLVPADENLEDEDILEMVNAGLVGMTVMDDHVANLWARVFDGLKVRDDLVLKSGNRKGWMFRKGSPKFKAVVDEFVSAHGQGTTFGNILINRYLRNAKYVTDAGSTKEMEKFRRIASLLQKYATEAGFDWLLIAATAYQESQLDNTRRSPAGAIGIMQVMPKTAAAPPIRIPDVRPLENNIRAGVKLLKYIRDEYFDEPDLDPLNKTLLTVASYNAGPSRISQCRRKAAEMGLDPNVWFHNVEFAVAKSVGRETVQYAANIYKYYLGYQIAVERGKQRIEARKDLPKPPGSR